MYMYNCYLLVLLCIGRYGHDLSLKLFSFIICGKELTSMQHTTSRCSGSVGVFHIPHSTYLLDCTMFLVNLLRLSCNVVKNIMWNLKDHYTVMAWHAK